MKKLLALLPLLLLLIYPSISKGAVGVGVGTGKIVVTEILHPGEIYNLPIFTVLNTGDEKTTYGVGISHRETQTELKPDPTWFKFSPSEFELDPTGAQNVEVTLAIPLRVEPGKYFAFVEGHPARNKEGGTKIGIAAASKLYFEVAPANVFVGLYYRLLTFWRNSQPWSNIIAITLVVGLVLSFIRRNFDLDFKLAKKSKTKAKDE